MSLDRRRQMVEPDHPRLSIVRQCELVSINRSGFYHRPAAETPLNLELMRLIDAEFLETPWYGSRQMARHLRREGYQVGRKRIRRLMARMGLTPIYQRPRTTVPNPGHRVFSYLLRDLVIDRPNQVCCPGLLRRHHLPANAPRLSLSGRGDGLGDAESAELAGFEHHGCGVLPRGFGGSPGPVRAAGDLQQRPGQPVHLAAVHRRIAASQARISMDGRGAGSTTCSSNGSSAA